MRQRLITMLLISVFLLSGGAVAAQDSLLEYTLKGEDTAEYFLPEEMVVSGQADVEFSAQIIEDDMYGVIATVFSSDGHEIAGVSVSASGVLLHMAKDHNPRTVLLSEMGRQEKTLSFEIDLANKVFSLAVSGGKKQTDIPFLDDRAGNVSGIRFTPAGPSGEGVRHVQLSGIEMTAQGETKKNVTKPPKVKVKTELINIFEERFDGANGTSLGGAARIVKDGEESYALLETESGQTSDGFKITFPKVLASGVYTINFDYCVFEESVHAIQCSFDSSGGTSGPLFNMKPDNIQCDQEELNPSSRSAIVGTGLSKGWWVHVILVVRPQDQSFDVYVNGSKTGNVRFRKKAATNVAALRILPGGGTDGVGLRKIGVDNLLIYEGEYEPETSSAESEETVTVTQYPQFPKEPYLQRLEGCWVFLKDHPYMLFDNQRAMYDCMSAQVTAVANEQEDSLLIPSGVPEELSGKTFQTVQQDGRAYIALDDLAEETGKVVTRYDDMYILSNKPDPFDADKEQDMIASVRDRFPSVKPVVKPEEYPFKIMYNNDLTNTLTCNWEARSKIEKDDYYVKNLLDLTVDETANTGIDIHALSPGMGRVPLWKSRTVPYKTQQAWVKKRFGIEAGEYLQYCLKGGDLMDDFIERCDKNGLLAFVSMRLNDTHHLENHKRGIGEVATYLADELSQFYDEHLDWVVGSCDNADHYKRGLDYTKKEVRDYMFNLMRDLCENYDIDGLELDFMHYPTYFKFDTTTVEERVQVMTEFTREVRAMLDATSVDGKYRYLGARIPSMSGLNEYIGLDLRQLADAGVDIFNITTMYTNDTNMEIDTVKNQVGDKFVMAEITHCTRQNEQSRTEFDDNNFTRTAPNQVYTTAHYAYSRGADGVSIFNWAYFREHGSVNRGPFNEPRFDIFRDVRNEEFVAKQAHQYNLFTSSIGSNFGNIPNMQVRRNTVKGKQMGFTFDIAIPEGGYKKKKGKIRMMFRDSASADEWTMKLNGVELKRTSDTSLNYDNPYPQMWYEPEYFVCFEMPIELVQEGTNFVSAMMTEGDANRLLWMDMLLQ